MKILAIETCFMSCSLAILNGENVEYYKYDDRKNMQSELIPQMIQESGIDLKKIDILAASCGPGTFTGIRIGLAIISGISLGINAKIANISSLDAVFAEHKIDEAAIKGIGENYYYKKQMGDIQYLHFEKLPKNIQIHFPTAIGVGIAATKIKNFDNDVIPKYVRDYK